MNERLYFAYGSNMDLAQMRRRCPAARSAGAGSALGWRFMINERGVATITPDAGARVHGLLWWLTPECEASLDGFEGVGKGFYYKEVVAVKTDQGSVDALVYIDSRDTLGLPRGGYLERVLGAADELKLPRDGFDHYLAWLAERMA